MAFRLRTMLALSLLLALMAGCGGAPATPSASAKPAAKAKTTTSQPPATGGPLGTVTIVAPAAGSTVTAGSVTVQLALSYFQFVSPRSGDAPGTGQVELSVNGTVIGVFTFLKDTITLKSTGPQTLTAELLTNGKLIPSSKTSVAFTVTAPTASSGASSSTSSGQGSSSGSGSGSTSSGSTTSSSGSSSTSGPYTVTSHQATVSGHSETVLTDTQGLTLYYLNTDTSTTSTCTGSCASIWPPLLLSGTLSLAPNLPGYLTVIQDANGAQVVYDGHPLYTYSGDSAPGQANGQGLLGTWFVVTPSP
ncbi:MAG: hypothetical protein ACYCOS_07615 [Sulfobacillus sp.]